MIMAVLEGVAMCFVLLIINIEMQSYCVNFACTR